MNRLYRLFEASPEAAFTELEGDLAQLKMQLAATSENATALRELLENVLRNTTMAAAAVPAPTRWTYDVRLPNLYFDNVFDPELVAGGAKRWVRSPGPLKARLDLPRNVQYDFSISVVDFAVPECRDSLRLAVDGRQYPWLSTDGQLFHTIIVENPDAEGLEFELSVDRGVLPDDKDVSFSFSAIDIVRRGASATVRPGGPPAALAPPAR